MAQHMGLCKPPGLRYAAVFHAGKFTEGERMTTTLIALPEAVLEGRTSVEGALYHRRSLREFSPETLPLAALGQLLWAAQGVTALGGYRTAPSAGALYPLELYVAVGQVHDLPPGLYHYQPQAHALRKVSGHDPRRDLGAAALGQTWLQGAPAILVLTGVVERVAAKYGAQLGRRFMFMEAGHVVQNSALQATALGLGSVVVAAFDEERVRQILKLKPEEAPLVLQPFGKP
jgi:SagB-type dehydrogenase family enzyme